MHAVCENCGLRLDVIIGSASATQNSEHHRNDVAPDNASRRVSSKPTEELTCGCSRKDMEGKGITPPLVTSEQNAGVGIEGVCQTEARGGYSLRPRPRPCPWPGPMPRLAETEELQTSGNNCRKREKITHAVPVEPSSSRGRVQSTSDMSLGSFARRNHYQGSGSNGFLIKDGIVFGESNMVKPASVLDRSCSKGQSWDLNERVSLISYNLLEKNKIPAQKEMDLFPFGLKERSYDQGNPKRSDQRADDIPMDIFELLAKQECKLYYIPITIFGTKVMTTRCKEAI